MVLEGLIYEYVPNNDFKKLLSPCQHGFVSGKCTDSNLLTYTNYLCVTFNK